MNNIKLSGNETNLQRAMSAARDLRHPINQSDARRYELCGLIDTLIGTFTRLDGRSQMSWPIQIAEAAGMPERHVGSGAVRS